MMSVFACRKIERILSLELDVFVDNLIFFISAGIENVRNVQVVVHKHHKNLQLLIGDEIVTNV